MKMEFQLRPIMADPSLLCKVNFWEAVTHLKKVAPLVYPRNIEFIEDADLWNFYGAYLRKRDALSVKEVIARCKKSFRSFVWREYYQAIPETLLSGFVTFRRKLEKSHLPIAVQNILLDEFVFLATQSSIISRLKKPFKFFEKFDAIPLLNLEKRAPPDLRRSIRGIKKAISFINWIATIGTFSIWLGPVMGSFTGSVITGIRLILIDPNKE